MSSAARPAEPAKGAAAAAQPSEQDQLAAGPLSLLMRAVKSGKAVLINLRNNHKIVAQVRAFDRHCNMVLENVREIWKEVPPGGRKAITRDRVVPKMFLRGDSVIVVVSGESMQASADAGAAAAASAGGAGAGR